MSFFVVKQLPVLDPDRIPEDIVMPIISRTTQLLYFNHDLDDWAEELWNCLSPVQKEVIPQLGEKQCFQYNDDDRAIFQAELDAIFAHLYGLNTKDLMYILDPEDICGKNCINETFRVMKDNEIRKYGEYRTKRLILEAWQRFGYDN